MNKTNFRRYSKTFKLKVLQEHYSSGQSKRSIEHKWKITRGLLLAWEKSFPIEKFPLSLPSESIEAYKMNHVKKEMTREEELQKRIDDLTRSLAYEKMRSRAFEKMIEITEKEEGISI